MNLEEQKKLVIPFLQRAQEIQTVEPKVAYYCRLYAAEEISKLGPGAADEIKGIMKALIMQLERDKPALAPLNPEADKQHCLSFALRIFRNADKADVAGKADLNTCKAYYAASIFLQATAHFNETDPETGEKELEEEVAQKARYAAWRAAEIRKAMKEGRPPVPPSSDLFVPAAAGDDGGAAAAGAAAAGAGGDPFAGPAYEPGGAEDPGPSVSSNQQLPDFPAPPSNLPMGGGIDSIGSAADDFLNLPPPPSTQLPPTPPAAAAAAQAVAALAGPRYRQGSKVLALLPSGELAAGTVGMTLAPGPNTLYKVAFKDHLAELPDSALAPLVGESGPARWLREQGAVSVPVTVLASNLDRWPPTYLVQIGQHMPFDTDCYHMLPAEEGVAAAGADGAASSSSGQAAPPPGAPPLKDAHGLGGGYPQIHPQAPAAPAAPSAPSPYSSLPTAPAPPPTVPPPARPTAPTATSPRAGAGAATGGGHHTAPGARGGLGGGPASPTHRAAAASHGAGGRPSAPPAAAAAAAAPPPATGIPAAVPGFQPSLQAIQEAHKAAKYAVSSLAFDDVAGGVKYLTDALKLLTQPSGK